MGATNYASAAILNQFLKGIAAAVPQIIYISLHTGDPGADGTANEVTKTQWPGYSRLDADKGPPGDGFTSPSGGAGGMQSTNTKDLYWPPLDGPASITLTHAALWDINSGNCLVTAALTAPKKLDPSDEVVFHAGQIVVSVT